MKNYLIEIEKIINECLFLYPEQKLCNAWNVESIEDFLTNKADILLKKIIEQKIKLQDVQKVVSRLHEKHPSFPPSMGEILHLMKPEHNYKLLFRQCQEQTKRICDFDYNQRNNTSVEYNQNAINELNNSSILLFNVVSQMHSLKSMSILSQEYDTCKNEFKEVFDKVYFMDENELQPIPKFVPKLTPPTITLEEAKMFSEKIKKILANNIIIVN